jgi:hypothetical protein
MTKKTILSLVVSVMIIAANAQSTTIPMTNVSLKTILDKTCANVEGQEGYWQAEYLDRLLVIITDSRYNRMRIISPIIEVKDLKKKQLEDAMSANFDKVLDAKYAIANDIVWSVFAHPLQQLTEDQVKDALNQVYLAAATFGTEYKSTNILFGGGDSENKKK